MRIIKLRLRNLNSLAGEWFFDFTHPEYISGGLFVITGPTGVGKTTILDAICLALYGATPRLDKISPSSNEIMSRGCGECLAEVTFETPAGRFRCLWSQHRSRQKADGKLQAARHEIVDDLNGRVIEAHLSKTQAEVEKITGMNFGQFTRSMMLAQGAFAAFLEAQADERADLLEQITGSGIYSDISMKVHQRQAQEKEKLKTLESRLAGLQPAGNDEAALVAQKTDLERKITLLNKQWAEQSRLLSRLESIAALKNDLTQLGEREKALTGEAGNFSALGLRLDQGLKAQKLTPIFERLSLMRNNLTRAENERNKLLNESAARLESANKAEKLVEQAEMSLARARSGEEAKAPLLARTRELDVEIREKERQVKTSEQQILGKRKELCLTLKLNLEDGDEAFGKRLAAIDERLNERRKKHAALAIQLKETLGGKEVSAWRNELASGESRLQDLEKLLVFQTELAQNTSELKENDERTAKAATEFNLSGQNLKQEQLSLAALEKDGRRLNDILTLSKQIQSLEEHRHKLQTGRPCPLCGSPSHPWVDPANIPALSGTEADLETNLKLCREKRDLINRLTARTSALEQFIKSAGEAGLKLKAREAELLEAIRQKGTGLALEPDTWRAVSLAKRLLAEQEKNRLVIQQLLKKVESLTADIDAEKDKILEAAEAAANGPGQLKEYELIKSAWLNLLADKEKLGRARREILGELSPEDEEKRLKAETLAAEKILNNARRESEKAAGELKSNQDLLKDLSGRLRELTQQIQEADNAFQRSLHSLDFGDEADWLATRLSEAELNELGKTARQLREKRLALETSRKDLEERLAREESQAHPGQSLEELRIRNIRTDEERLEIQQKLGALNQKLTDIQKEAERHRELSVEIERQKRDKSRWDNLHSLIGSADGKKFRNFVQGLTFEVLTGLANRQLINLTDRYTLIRDPDRPLELNVMDNYQAGEIRSTKNLSGGESFIVSLALALGLSQMASRRVRVDSLFLDEGFGTLDEDSLETVLDALSSLREEGKLIGLISHIPALTERIAVQIKVSPLGGARSSVSGPGVSRAALT